MTATLTLEAQRHLDRYLQEVRLLLRGAKNVDVAEVEGDIRQHIDTELAARNGEVTAEELGRVLGRLGTPGELAGEEDIAPWRRAVARLYMGEDWRLAYICLATTVLGAVLLPALPPVGLILFAAAFLLARSAVSLAEERGEELGPRRWLVLAPIAIVVVPVVIAVLAGPIIPLGQVGYEEGWFASLGIGPAHVDAAGREALVRIGLIGLTAGVWWIVLAGLLLPLRRAANAMVKPLFTLDAGTRRRLAVTGVVLAVLGAAVLGVLAARGPVIAV